MESLIQQINALSRLKYNWDGQEGTPPSQQLIRNIEEFVRSLNLPASILSHLILEADPSGGILISLENGSDYIAYTFYNNGLISVCKHSGGKFAHWNAILPELNRDFLSSVESLRLYA